MSVDSRASSSARVAAPRQECSAPPQRIVDAVQRLSPNLVGRHQARDADARATLGERVERFERQAILDAVAGTMGIGPPPHERSGCSGATCTAAPGSG